MKVGVPSLAHSKSPAKLEEMKRRRTTDSRREPDNGPPDPARSIIDSRPTGASALLDAPGKQGLAWNAVCAHKAAGTETPAEAKALNTASVARLSRKLMAQEWARALGRPSKRLSQELAQMERQAEDYVKEKERKQALEASARERAKRLILSLQQSLAAFGRSLRELPPEERAGAAEELLAKSLRTAGDVHHIRWSSNGCEITFESWEQRRARRKSRRCLPMLFRAGVDERLRLVACEPLTGEQYEAACRESIVDRIVACLRRHPGDPDAFEDALWRIGRIVRRSETKDNGVMVSVEPWEEVRRRRIERKNRSAIKTYIVSADAALRNVCCEPC